MLKPRIYTDEMTLNVKKLCFKTRKYVFLGIGRERRFIKFSNCPIPWPLLIYYSFMLSNQTAKCFSMKFYKQNHHFCLGGHLSGMGHWMTKNVLSKWKLVRLGVYWKNIFLSFEKLSGRGFNGRKLNQVKAQLSLGTSKKYKNK